MLHSLYSIPSVYLGTVLVLTRPSLDISVNAALIIIFFLKEYNILKYS